MRPLDIHWLEQSDNDVPDKNGWLSSEEILRLSGMRFLKRRSDWKLGRWTAKRALAARLGLPEDISALAQIEIKSAPSGAPEAFLYGEAAPARISISHREGIAMCTIGPAGAGIGCDLETVESRSDAFVADYFTANERSLVQDAHPDNRSLLVALLWSAKECALKALQVGLRLDTNCMDVNAVDGLDWQGTFAFHHAAGLNSWHPLKVRYDGTQVFYGWWRVDQRMVRTMISTLPHGSPIHIAVGSRVAAPYRIA